MRKSAVGHSKSFYGWIQYNPVHQKRSGIFSKISNRKYYISQKWVCKIEQKIKWNKFQFGLLLNKLAQPKTRVIWLTNENQPIFNIITHDKVNNEYNHLASCTVPEHVSSFREPSVSDCVEGTVAIPEPKQSLIHKCFDTSGYVRSLFVLDSPIHVLSDSYPVIWLTKVVALLPPFANSFALYGLYGLALTSIRIGRLAIGWPSKLGTTNERRIWSRYFCPLKVPSMTYKSILQYREKHPQTVKPPPPNAVVPTICSCWNVVFLGLHTRTRPSTGFN